MHVGKRAIAEFLGTFWLTFGGCGSAVIAAAYPQLGIGFVGVVVLLGGANLWRLGGRHRGWRLIPPRVRLEHFQAKWIPVRVEKM
jgi:hypothetical protein